MKYDYMIVGGGLAGAILAKALISRSKKLLMFDPGHSATASRIAAGLFNPFTGPRMVKTWKADVLFDFIHRYYPKLQEQLGASFFHVQDMYRPFNGYDEQNDWLARRHDPAFAPYVREVFSAPRPGGEVHDPVGGLLQRKSGFVDTVTLLDALLNYIGQRADLRTDELHEDMLRVGRSGIRYGHYEAERIIFCTGHAQRHGTLFGWVPIGPLKGEILTIKREKPLKTLCNRGCFIIPWGDRQCRAGSTYRNNDDSLSTTEMARQEISGRIRALLKGSFEVTGQVAGIRPAIPDRRPVVGLHPEWDRVAIFNGLGTKGVSLAPYHADGLVRFLEDGDELDPEVNIERYYSLYYQSLSEH